MIVIGPITKAERLEVMLWAAGSGPETRAVQRFIERQQVTFAVALITRSKFGALEVCRWN